MSEIAQITDQRSVPSGPASGVGALQLSLGGANGHDFDFAALFAALQSAEGAVVWHAPPDPEAAPAFEDALPPNAARPVAEQVEGVTYPDVLAVVLTFENGGSAREQATDAVQSAEALLGLLPPAEPRAPSHVVPLRPAVQILVAQLIATFEAGVHGSDLSISTGRDINPLAMDDENQVLDLAFLADWLKAPIASAQDGGILANEWPVEHDASFKLGVVYADLAKDPEQPVSVPIGEMMQLILRATQAQWPTGNWDIIGDLTHPPVRIVAATAFDAGVYSSSVWTPEGAVPFVQTVAPDGADVTPPSQNPAPTVGATAGIGKLPGITTPITKAEQPLELDTTANKAPERRVKDAGMDATLERAETSSALSSRAATDIPKPVAVARPGTPSGAPGVDNGKAEQPLELDITADKTLERSAKDAGIDAALERADTSRVLSPGTPTDIPKPVAVAPPAQPYTQTRMRTRPAFEQTELRAAKDGTASRARATHTGVAVSMPPRASHQAPMPIWAAEPARADLGGQPAVQNSGVQMSVSGGAGTSGGMTQGQNLPAVLDLQRQGWTKALVNRAAGLAQGGSTLTLKILPQHLGQMTLKLTAGRKGMDLRIFADVPSTVAMLRGIETQISSAFEEAGLPLENYSAQTGKEGDGTEPDDDPQPNSNEPDDIAPAALEDENAQPSSRADQSLLNIVV